MEFEWKYLEWSVLHPSGTDVESRVRRVWGKRRLLRSEVEKYSKTELYIGLRTITKMKRIIKLRESLERERERMRGREKEVREVRTGIRNVS